MDVEELRKTLEGFGQSHLLEHWADLSPNEQQHLYDDLQSIPYDEMASIFDRTMNPKNGHSVTSADERMEPISDDLCASVVNTSPDSIQEYRQLALDNIAQGRVGVLLLAGGQGTRLGVPYPKGMYKIGLPSGKTLYQIQVERVLRLQKLASSKSSSAEAPKIVMYVMTSEHTMGPTVDFFKQHDYFGMDPENIKFFEQRMIPCFQNDGKIILETKSKVARAPDGNGGLYWALKNEGTLDDMVSRGIDYLHVYCVDNVLVKVADPVFMGYCISKNAEAGNKVCEKAFPTEAVGVVCRLDGKYQVVEYSEIKEETASLRRPDNPSKLVYNAGNICNHFYTTKFLLRVCNDHDQSLPYHIAKKKIPTVGGEKVQGVKLEKFVFDVFQFTEKFVVWECLREEEFSPLKNADDPSKKDTPTTARNALFALHRKYLTEAGATLAPKSDGSWDEGQKVEISPLLSYAGENLEGKVSGQTFVEEVVTIDP